MTSPTVVNEATSLNSATEPVAQLVTYQQADGLATICLNRPSKLNALTAEMLLALREIFSRIQKDSELRAVILTGAGDKAFCAGTDIDEMANLEPEAGHVVSQRGQAVCEQIARCPIPVIAAINGLAAGGGCELALACHLRLAAKKATFSLPEIKLGLIPGYGGTQRLAREIGSARALEMSLTGKSIGAAAAYDLGIVNQVVDFHDLAARSEALAREIAKLAPLAIRACLKAVTQGLDLPLDQGLVLESDLFAKLFRSADVREGTRAFLEKRQPVFRGK